MEIADNSSSVRCLPIVHFYLDRAGASLSFWHMMRHEIDGRLREGSIHCEGRNRVIAWAAGAWIAAQEQVSGDRLRIITHMTFKESEHYIPPSMVLRDGKVMATVA